MPPAYSRMFKSSKQKNSHFLWEFFGRDERIWTSGFLHPMQALYQAELRPVNIFTIYFLYVQEASDFLSCSVKLALVAS